MYPRAAGDLGREVGIHGVSLSISAHVGSLLAGSEEALEDARSALYRAGALVLEALPFLVALGLGESEAVRQLDFIDLDPLVARPEPPTAGQLEPITDRLNRVLASL
jgi:hypothetical protein